MIKRLFSMLRSRVRLLYLMLAAVSVVLFALFAKDLYSYVLYNFIATDNGFKFEKPPRALYDYSEDQIVDNSLEGDFGVCPLQEERCVKILMDFFNSKELESAKTECQRLYLPLFDHYDSKCTNVGRVDFLTSDNFSCDSRFVVFIHGRDSEPRLVKDHKDRDYHNKILKEFDKKGIQYIAPFVNPASSFFSVESPRGSVYRDVNAITSLVNNICPNKREVVVAGISYGAYLTEILSMLMSGDQSIKKFISVNGMMRRESPTSKLSFVYDIPTPRSMLNSGFLDSFMACGRVSFVNALHDKDPESVLTNKHRLQLIRTNLCPNSKMSFDTFDGLHEVPTEQLIEIINDEN